ncbi:hypothetical protein [Streptomyces sp. NPDC093225]|uniref:hypothetical protein n=1 Tax=Streptomyces sp. NPDC093225 TaxID=3366034 RepID=UPI003816E2A5
MTPSSDSDALAQATVALSHPGLIRIVTEIDDNGPLQRHLLSRTLTSLSRQQLRHATKAGRTLGLLRIGTKAGVPSLLLTRGGTELAEIYDMAARWARTQRYPAPVADFVVRVQSTLTLLGAAGPFEDGDAVWDEDLDALRAAFTSWLRDHAADSGRPTPGRASAGWELAA